VLFVSPPSVLIMGRDRLSTFGVRLLGFYILGGTLFRIPEEHIGSMVSINHIFAFQVESPSSSPENEYTDCHRALLCPFDG
jgi:hypothetical protein